MKIDVLASIDDDGDDQFCIVAWSCEGHREHLFNLQQRL